MLAVVQHSSLLRLDSKMFYSIAFCSNKYFFFTLYLPSSHPIHTQPPSRESEREGGERGEWEERGGGFRDGLCARLFMWLFQPHASYNYV